jgi:hypothetical protein
MSKFKIHNNIYINYNTSKIIEKGLEQYILSDIDDDWYDSPFSISFDEELSMVIKPNETQMTKYLNKIRKDIDYDKITTTKYLSYKESITCTKNDKSIKIILYPMTYEYQFKVNDIFKDDVFDKSKLIVISEHEEQECDIELYDNFKLAIKNNGRDYILKENDETICQFLNTSSDFKMSDDGTEIYRYKNDIIIYNKGDIPSFVYIKIKK